MKKTICLVWFVCLWPCLVLAEIKLHVVDSAGLPISNAVISVSSNAVSTDFERDALSIKIPAVMDQIEKQFSPHVLIVDKGQSVVFPNSDQVRHHVYSFSKPNDFEIRLYSGDQAEPVNFNYPGIAVLGCNIHDQMVGYIYIKDSEIAQLTDANGMAVFEDVMINNPDEKLLVSVWHSRLSSNKTDRLVQTLEHQDENGIWQLSLELLPEIKKTIRKFKPRY